MTLEEMRNAHERFLAKTQGRAMKNTPAARRRLAIAFAEQSFHELSDDVVLSVQDWESLLRRFQQALDGVFPSDEDPECMHVKTWGL